MKANPVDKDAVAETLAPMRNLFTKSVVACRDLPAGTVLLESHLTLKKPGTGFPPSSLKNLVGQTLKRPVKADQMLQRADFV
jgi:sialic acid synthase SpsE